MEAEATMICVDNSSYMIKPLFQEQVDAIEYYCTEKLNANPRNVVGVASMAGHYLRINATCPTRDLEKIMLGVRSLPRGGDLLLREGVTGAERVLCTNLNKDLPKRIVVFVGGVLNEDTDTATRLGLWLKNRDIAFDAVNFGHQLSHKKKFLETLVATAENKGNSRTLHVPPNLSVSQALASSQIIPTRIIGEGSSPPPDIKDKEYYSRIPYVSQRDMVLRSFDDMFERARKAAALEEEANS